MAQPIKAAPQTVIIWRLLDGRPGHESQTLGLIRAMQRRLPVRTFDLATDTPLRALFAWVRGRFPAGNGLPDPDLILGAGHATHMSLLAACRARGGRSVVLMRPSLPVALFDLALIPAHDEPSLSPRVLLTRGVLNTIVPIGEGSIDRGLILIGGPSKHYAWRGDEILAQVIEVVSYQPDVSWRLTTSRRTPDNTLAQLQRLKLVNLQVVPWRATDPNWIPRALAQVRQVWISEDSVAMVYEALTSGVACALLRVPRRGTNRVSRGLDALVASGLLTPIEVWRAAGELMRGRHPFNEAERVAEEICRRWFPHAV